MTSKVSPLLVALMHLTDRARQAGTFTELLRVIVNETNSLTVCRQVVVWNAKGVVEAISGQDVVDDKSPFVRWLRRLFKVFYRESSVAPVFLDGSVAPDRLQKGWKEWLPQQAIALPVKVGETGMGWLLLAREFPFSEAESRVLYYLAGVYAHAWVCHPERKRSFGWRYLVFLKKKWGMVAVLGLGLSWKIPLTVLAPAEIVPSQPEVVKSPREGIVEKFYVEPNSLVSVGQPLFALDATLLNNRLAVAQKDLAIGESEYQVTSQLALQNPHARIQLAILVGRLEEKLREADGLRDLLARSQVKATKSGMVLFNDPQSWIGRPVVTGEKVMMIAGERDAEVEAWLTPGDLIPLPGEVGVTMFLNVDPLHPLAARMRFLAYESMVRPDATVAHQLRATLKDKNLFPRLGLKGIARIEGERVSVLWWLVRRPVTMVRQWLGY